MTGNQEYEEESIGLALLTRPVSFAKSRTSAEQKWHSVRPMDHWMMLRASQIFWDQYTIAHAPVWQRVLARFHRRLTRKFCSLHSTVEKEAHVRRFCTISPPPRCSYALSNRSFFVLYFEIFLPFLRPFPPIARSPGQSVNNRSAKSMLSIFETNSIFRTRGKRFDRWKYVNCSDYIIKAVF